MEGFAEAAVFVRWDEVCVSTDKGRREVHYYLKRSDGSSDLAVVGKEKSLRHMSYHYAIRNRSLFPMASFVKLKSRREVVDWLSSIVSDTSPRKLSDLGVRDSCKPSTEIIKDTVMRKLGHHTAEFLWLGSPWTTRRKRRHYQSFTRNGVVVSVHDFVIVLAEEDKHLVAYLEDMYEDSKGNKMVVVRWFHKVDEVGIVLPHKFNDREIFFSLCLQDLSIECIDGLATVLSPQHFEKFHKEATQTHLEPFVCHKQFENDDVKPFDITQVKGYWKQEILRFMHTLSPSKVNRSSDQSVEGLKVEESVDANGIRSKKRRRSLKDDDMHLEYSDGREPLDVLPEDVADLTKLGPNCRTKSENCSLERGRSGVNKPAKEVKTNLRQHLAVGSQVEVLSQDSGIKGCWFRASVIKKCKDRVKLRYEDIMDGADESKKLEEWILASRIATSDELGLRICGRPRIRPFPLTNKGRVLWAVDVGAVVDAWSHDGWWEGIVVQKENEDRLHVYFPGEKRVLVVEHSEVRQSQEWLGDHWAQIKDRPELVSSISSSTEPKLVGRNLDDGMSARAAVCDSRAVQKETQSNDSRLLSENENEEKVKQVGKVPDLLKDDLLTQLKWKSSRKRRRGNGNSVQKLNYIVANGKSTRGLVGSGACERFMIAPSLKVDHENCKYLGDSFFGSSVAPPLTSLVM